MVSFYSLSSPKRKRHPPTVATIPPTPPNSSPTREMRINTSVPGVVLENKDNRQGSPRTKVAYNFQGLQLEGPGGVPAPSKLDLGVKQEGKGGPNKIITTEDLAKEDLALEAEEDSVRKRVKGLKSKPTSLDSQRDSNSDREIPETPRVQERARDRQFTIAIGSERQVDPALVQRAKAVILSNEVDPVIFRGSSAPRVKNEGGMSQSKAKTDPEAAKSEEAPPLFGAAEASLEMGNESMDVESVDPDRASMTWHDDEITGHNPDDPDDDGEGINGIGFKPTPAEAYARVQKRKQQMTEYRNREARDARRIRGERRRTHDVKRASLEEQETARRVRFLEAETNSIIQKP